MNEYFKPLLNRQHFKIAFMHSKVIYKFSTRIRGISKFCYSVHHSPVSLWTIPNTIKSTPRQIPSVIMAFLRALRFFGLFTVSTGINDFEWERDDICTRKCFHLNAPYTNLDSIWIQHRIWNHSTQAAQKFR